MNRPSNWVVFAGFLVAMGGTLLQAEAGDRRRPKKLIETGWDEPNTRTLRENLADMEKSPFDGIVIEVVGRREDGKDCGLRGAFVNERWRRAWFQSCIDDMKACRFQRFTDNFFLLGANPGNVDWFDDAGWKTIVEHWRIAAWLAKQTGVKGLLFDPEPYTEPFSQFRYHSQPQAAEHSFDEYCDKARQRGSEVMQAVAEEYPGIAIFCYFMDSITASATGRADPNAALENQGYGLYPAFIDGWLDRIPPTMTLVDGCESAYRYNSQKDFLEAGVRIKGVCQELVSPENRAKYRAAVQVSFGIYLDAYWNPKDSQWGNWYIDGLGGSRVDRLRANVKTAVQVADEYVWIYGEKYRWWPTPSGGVKPQTWPEVLPGCDDALRLARDPNGYAIQKIEQMKQAAALENLVRNGEFAAEAIASDKGGEVKYREGGPPAGWNTWQEDGSKGTFTWDRESGAAGKGAARAAGIRGGCLLQSCPVHPGQVYVVRAVRKLHGKGGTMVRIRWQTPDEKWTAEEQDQFAYTVGPVDAWANLFSVVQVPEGAGRLVVMLGVRGQRSDADVAWFDDVELYRLQ